VAQEEVIVMAIGVQVVIDCADPSRLAKFWAEVLGYQEQPPPPGYDTWEQFATAQGIPPERWNDFGAVIDPDGQGPRLFFQRVPEPKTVKNRVHLDVNASRGVDGEARREFLAAEVERLVALGATEVREVDEPAGHHIVMRDPEGNEFCVQ
jgi:catechol 2,3-dioxygenase-like lactoylglutathione lyase family enzyme